MPRYLLDTDPRREQRRQSLLLDRLEARYRPSFSREIKRSMREMIDAYSQTGEIGPPRDHHEKTQQLFERMATDSAVVFGKRIIEQGKSAGLLIEHKEDFASMMRRLAVSYIGQEAVRKRITSIADTTREQIIAQVDRGYQDGLGVAEIAKMISGNVEQISRWRGALIARTETHSAANFGADRAARETGLPLRKEWVSAEDERTRAAHRAADGQAVGMDDAFEVGGESLMRPGDPAGSAANTVNCRCGQSFIVDED